MATKTSILIFYLRMSKNTQNLLRIASYITLGVVNVAGVVLLFLNAFQCSPPTLAYTGGKNPNSSDKCIPIITLFLCSAPVNIITDLAILVLPIPVLTGMRLPQRQKTILVITFLLGIFVTIVDVIRIYYLQQAVSQQIQDQALVKIPIHISNLASNLGASMDYSWNGGTAFMWSAIEVNIGIICACIPTLKPLIKRIMPAMLTGAGDGSHMDKTGSFASHNPIDPVEAPHRPSSIAESPPQPPAQPAHVGGDPEEQMDMMDFLTVPGTHPAEEPQMGMMDFLTTPEGLQPGTMNRSTTMHTATTADTVYFGFVNMKRPKSMLKTKGLESFKYCATVTLLFFLWGFSYGLLNTLNLQIAAIARYTTTETLGLTTAYFGAYFFGALIAGQYILRHAGFKSTFISGLCIYGTGTLCFWPSAVLTSYPGFIISNFVVGFGLSVLETAANPFLALCGPSHRAEYRLMLAQAVQATASVLSQLLAQKALFKSNLSLIDVQWTYLSVALFTVILALFFYYMPLPEATDSDLILLAENLEIYPQQTLSSKPYFKNPNLLHTTLILATLSQFFYVAAQENLSTYFDKLLTSIAPSLSSLSLSENDFLAIGHTTFALSRFIFAPLCLIIPPRILLLVSFIGCILFSILTTTLSLSANGVSGLVLMLFFFEGPIYPLIFAIGLRGMGKKTKMAAGFLTAACVGGGSWPFVMWAVQYSTHRSVQFSFVVIVALCAAGIIFPLYLCCFERARFQVDPRKQTGLVGADHEEDDWRRSSRGADSPMRRMSRKFSVIFEKIRIPGAKRGNSRGSEEGFAEHRERKSLRSQSRGRSGIEPGSRSS